MMMVTSPSGRAFIEREEGCKLAVYRDIAGYDTVGVGHKLLPGESYPSGITQAQCDALLANDLRITEGCVNAKVLVPVGQNSFDAMISLSFNIGTGGFIGSTVLRELNAGNPLAAADAFRLWNKAMIGGQLTVSYGLAARRERERALFLLDVSTVDDA